MFMSFFNPVPQTIRPFSAVLQARSMGYYQTHLFNCRALSLRIEIPCAVSSSKFPVGSSARIVGDLAGQRPRDGHPCCWPPESLSTFRFASSFVRPNRSKNGITAFFEVGRTFSRGGQIINQVIAFKNKKNVFFAITPQPCLSMSFPTSKMLPPVGQSNPPSKESSVVLPYPDGPRTAYIFRVYCSIV